MSNYSDKIRRGCPEAPEQQKQPGQPPRPAVFLDRDGVVNADKGYVHDIDEFEWMPGAVEAMRFLNQRGYLVFVVTNQSGIGLRYYQEEEFMFLTLWMLEHVDNAGVNIDAVYYCPHHPESPDQEYLAVCPARKPGAGMLTRAAEEFEIDVSRSFLVGNRESDLGAAKAFGIPGYMYESGDLAAFVREIVEG